MFSLSSQQQYTTTEWDADLASGTISGPKSIEEPLRTAQIGQSADWAGYNFCSPGSTLGRVSTQPYTFGGTSLPPSGQINNKVHQVVSSWVGLMSDSAGDVIGQTGWGIDFTSRDGYSTWWEFYCITSSGGNCGNAETGYGGQGCFPTGGDTLYLDVEYAPSSNQITFIFDDLSTKQDCTHYYTPFFTFNPYFAGFITEAYSINNVIQQITEFGTSTFAGEEILTTSGTVLNPNSLFGSGWYFQSNLAQSNPQQNGYNAIDAITSTAITQTWQNSWFDPTYMCNTYGADCGI